MHEVATFLLLGAMTSYTHALLPLPESVFMSWSQRRMLSVSTSGCRLMDDSDSISWMTERTTVREIGDNELDYMVEACNVMRRPISNRPALFLYPGTKWCGSGNIAYSYDDLGTLNAEDSCCRDHDYCPASLRAGQCRNGVCNHSPFTRSHCECDLQFRRCLKNVGSTASHALGALYFNIARLPCFSEAPRPPQRRSLENFASCPGPYCNYRENQPRYQYHRLAPYSAPLFGGLQFPSFGFASVVPTAISSVLLTVFKFIGAA